MARKHIHKYVVNIVYLFRIMRSSVTSGRVQHKISGGGGAGGGGA